MSPHIRLGLCRIIPTDLIYESLLPKYTNKNLNFSLKLDDLSPPWEEGGVPFKNYVNTLIYSDFCDCIVIFV